MGTASALGDTVWMDQPFVIGGLELATDLSAADWVVAGVRGFGEHTVGSLVPAGFPAYARVFHPARRRVAGRDRDVRWAQVARVNGRISHPAMEWASITGSWRFLHGDIQPGVWDEEPSEGSMPRRQLDHLAGLLAGHTEAAERCWFAVWEGFAGLRLPLDRSPRVRMPPRPMLLLSGPLSAAATPLATAPDQFASLWWPKDRAWCVATDVDLMTTYVCGSSACVDRLVADDDLEALPVSVDQRITWDSDQLNPLPPRPG